MAVEKVLSRAALACAASFFAGGLAFPVLAADETPTWTPVEVAAGTAVSLSSVSGLSDDTWVDKRGEGTLLVDVSRTVPVRVSAGTLRLASSDVTLSAVAGGVIVAGGVLDLNGGSVTIAQSADAGAEPSIAGGSVIRDGTLVYDAGTTLYLPWTSGTVVLDHVDATCRKNLFAFAGDTGDRALVISNASSFACGVKTSSQVMSSDYASGFQTRIEVCDHSTFSHLGAALYVGQQKNKSTGRGALVVTGGSTAETMDLYLSDYVGKTHDSLVAVTNAALEATSITFVHNGSNYGLDRLLASNAVLTVNSINPRSRWKDLNYVELTDCRVNARKDGTWIENAAPNDQWAVYESYRVAGQVTLATDYLSTVALKASMTGSGSVVKDGSGTLTYLGPQKYSGLTVVSNGTLVLSWDAATAAATGSGKGLPAAKVISVGDVYVAPQGTLQIAYTNAFANTRSLSVDGALLVATNSLRTVPVTTVNNLTFGTSGKVVVAADGIEPEAWTTILKVKGTLNAPAKIPAADRADRPWRVKTVTEGGLTLLQVRKTRGLAIILR